MAYAVIAEKYVQSTAVQTETIILFKKPLAIGIVPFIRLDQLSRRCVLGSTVNPRVISECDLVELISKM
jgi:hypothetical protein